MPDVFPKEHSLSSSRAKKMYFSNLFNCIHLQDVQESINFSRNIALDRIILVYLISLCSFSTTGNSFICHISSIFTQIESTSWAHQHRINIQILIPTSMRVFLTIVLFYYNDNLFHILL